MAFRVYSLQVAARVGVALAVVAAAAGLAAALFPPPADCLAHARNPYRFRDWPNFINAISRAGETPTVALISDSQAYAGEYPSSKGYPARLEALLNERQVGGQARWEVLNFSSDGVTTPEYMAVAARLRTERPTWLIVVCGSADFRAENYRAGLLYARSDLPRLLTEARLMPRLSRAFWRRHGRVEDFLTAWLTHRNPLLRFRDLAWSWLEVRFPGCQAAFYAPRTTFRFWDLPGKHRIPPAPPPFPAPPGGEQIDLTYNEHSTVLLNEFLDQLAAIPAAHRLVIAAPLRTTGGHSPEGAWIAAFRRDLQRLCAEKNLPFWDLTEALPAEDFITSSHFHDRNHKRMAELLAGRLAAEMER